MSTVDESTIIVLPAGATLRPLELPARADAGAGENQDVWKKELA
jgi:hypothetical protein